MSKPNPYHEGCTVLLVRGLLLWGAILLVILLNAFTCLLWEGIKTPWGKFNIDIAPPRIWIMEVDDE